jgi:Recombination endonuclease VII
MKRCSKCGVQQPIDQFYRAKGTRDGLRGDCKTCFAKRARAHYLANAEREIARVKQWQQANPERVRAVQRKRRMRPNSKLADRASHLKRKYGMTLKQYEEMLEAQEGGCAICGRPPRPDVALHIDHEHTSGRIRGLLCFSCNAALGYFGDDGDRLVSAAAYLGPAPRDPALLKRLAGLKQMAHR